MKGRKFIPLLVVAAGLLAYHNSFTGSYFYDDLHSIPENPTIRHLWPIWQCLSPPRLQGLPVQGRPVINLSLAINYALGGYNVWGYHALNLAVHILAGLTLLGIVRRTLLQPRLRDRFGAAANELALAVAVLWIVHPLQTESVTYIIQRAESIMGLFYLLTLYCFIRGVESPRAHLWYGMSVTACALGMATKEVMVSAPLMVMLYDRAFVSGSFREAGRRRWSLYLGLAATWILFGYLLTLTLGSPLTNAERTGLSSWKYLVTEPGVILYYLRLSVWPSPLRMNHPWPIARTWMSILPPTVAVVILLGASAWAWRRRNPVWGFVGAWFFLILAPSSSFVPIPDPIYEHRMYLSLAAVVSAVVMGLYSVAGRRSLALFVMVGIGLGVLTWRRNQDYRRNTDYNLGVALQRAGRIQEAIAHYEQALRIAPDDAVAHYNLGTALERAGRMPEAIGHWEQALRLKPDFADAQYNLGNALSKMGKMEEAIGHYKQALRIKPDFAEAHYNLGGTLVRLGRVQEATEHYEQALRFDPNLAQAHYHLGLTLEQLGRVPEAIRHYEEALRIKPDYAEAHNNLGLALLELGKVQAAIEHWKQALRNKPDYVDPYNNLGSALAQLGRVQEAVGYWEQALGINPDYPEAHYNLGVALEQAGRVQEAIGHYEQALRNKPDYAEAQSRLVRLRALVDRTALQEK